MDLLVTGTPSGRSRSPNYLGGKTVRLFSATKCKSPEYMPYYHKSKKIHKILSHFTTQAKTALVDKLNVNFGFISNKSLNSTLSILNAKHSNATGVVTQNAEKLTPFKYKSERTFELSNYKPFQRGSISEEANLKQHIDSIPITSTLCTCNSDTCILLKNDYVRQLAIKDDTIESLKSKIQDLEKYIQLQGAFKTRQLLKDIDLEKEKVLGEQRKIIEAYENAIKYLKFYNIQTPQQNAFLQYLSESNRLQEENIELRNKLADIKKYILSQSQV